MTVTDLIEKFNAKKSESPFYKWKIETSKGVLHFRFVFSRPNHFEATYVTDDKNFVMEDWHLCRKEQGYSIMKSARVDKAEFIKGVSHQLSLIA